MPIISTATSIAISDFVLKNLSTYFFKKGLDSVLAATQKDYKDELRKAILRSLFRYEELYPVKFSSDKFPFYHSQKIINELISLGIMDRDYDLQKLLNALESEQKIITPSKKNIEDFLAIFKEEVNVTEGLERLAIKATYQEEIFHISRKLTAIENKFENAFNDYSAELEQQWKNRLDTYLSMLKEFKPRTALNLLDALLESFTSSTKMPPQKLLGKIWHQKGACLKILNRPEESHKAYIRAYNYDDQSQLNQEQAAFAYYKLDDLAKARNVGQLLLKQDEYNPVGWAIKCLSSTINDFANTICEVPNIVKKDIGFRVSLHNILNQEKNEEKLGQLYLVGLVPTHNDYVPEEININNIGRQGYWINLMIHDYFKNHFFDFNTIKNEAKTELVTLLNDLLKRFLGALEVSELRDDQTTMRFLLAYTNYLLQGNTEQILEMKTWHDRLNKKSNHLTLLCANTLQIAGFIEEAIQLLEILEDPTYEIFQLLAFCYLKKDDGDGYGKAVKKICERLVEVSDDSVPMFANQIVELKQFEMTEMFKVSDFTEGKVFEQEEDAELVRHIAITLLEGANAESTSTLLKLADSIADDKILGLIASTLYLCEKNDEAVKIFRKYISTDSEKEGRDLYYYIRALYATKKDNQELLKLLERWRLRFSFNPVITRLELQAYSELTDWQKVVEIGEYYLQELPEDEGVLARFLYALYEIGTPETLQKISELAEQLSTVVFRNPEHASVIGQILIKTRHFTLGFEMLYRFAIDPEQKELRMAYFTIFAEYRDEFEETWPAKEFDTVEPGHFVKYSINEAVRYIELTDQNLKLTPFKEFPGCGKGGAFTVKRPLSGQEDLIFIERIMNKYLYLHDIILDQVSSNPYSGVPMESIEIDPDDITSIERVFVKLIGEKGSVEKEYKEKLTEQYYNREISFSQVITSCMKGQYLAGYFELSQRLKGINIVPIVAFQPSASTRFLLDMSSLPIIYQMVNQHQVNFAVSFVLAKHHADHIKHLIAELKAEDREQMSLSVTLEGVTPHFVTEEAKKSNLTYLEGILDWVNKNCEIRLCTRALDFTRQASADGPRSDFFDYLINNIVILEEDPELGMITDDTIFYKLGVSPNRLMSSEFFAKRNMPLDSPALDEFLVNHYRGFTPSVSQLNNQFNNRWCGRPSKYILCLENLSASNNTQNISTGVSHIRWLVIDANLSEQELKSAICDVFKHLLEGSETPNLKAFIHLTVNEKFKLLGKEREFVLQCLNDSI